MHLGVWVTAMASGTRLRHQGLYWGGVLPRHISPSAIKWGEDIVSIHCPPRPSTASQTPVITDCIHRGEGGT